MKRTNNDQLNTKVYWNYIYTTPAREVEYWTKTNRFPTALSYIKDGDKVMDIGCGVGVLLREAKKQRKGCELWGIDISSEVVSKNIKEDPDIHYEQGEVGNLAYLPHEYFDFVFSGETLEHLDTPSQLFADGFRILKPGGTMIITTPQDDHIDSPEHVWYFEKQDIINLFTQAGFTTPEFVELPDMEHMIVFFAVGKKP